MTLGYCPNNILAVPEIQLFLMPGLRSPEDGIRIGGLRLSRIEFAEFLIIEKSKFTDDLTSVFVYGKGPLYCIFSGYETDEDVLRVLDGERRASVRRLARSLWLLKEGALYNPLDFIIYKRVGATNTRDTSHFGRMPYQIHAEYSLDSVDLAPLEDIYHNLLLYDDARSVRRLDMADYLFVQSHSAAITSDTERMLILISSLEAVLGSSVEGLLAASWLDDKTLEFLDRFRQVRNGVAHGRNSPLEDDVVTLRQLLRIGLRSAYRRALEGVDPSRVCGRDLVSELADSAQNLISDITQARQTLQPAFDTDTEA